VKITGTGCWTQLGVTGYLCYFVAYEFLASVDKRSGKQLPVCLNLCLKSFLGHIVDEIGTKELNDFQTSPLSEESIMEGGFEVEGIAS